MKPVLNNGSIILGDRRWSYVEAIDGGAEMWTDSAEAIAPADVRLAADSVRAEMSSDLLEPMVRVLPSVFDVLGELLDDAVLCGRYDAAIKRALETLGVRGADAMCEYGMPSEYRGWLRWARDRATKLMQSDGGGFRTERLRSLAEELAMGTASIAMSMREGRHITSYVTAVCIKGLEDAQRLADSQTADEPRPTPDRDDRRELIMKPLSGTFHEALAFASALHAKQSRKGTAVPYDAHLLAVASIVLEAGGTEDEAIAALLHDAPEDQGGLKTLRAIRDRFGERVGDIVSACSDTFDDPKPPWRERKRSYIAHLRTADRSTLLVSAADKLHNARATLRDLQRHGAAVWTRFSAGRRDVIENYRSVLSAYESGEPDERRRHIVAELATTIDELSALNGE